MKKLVYLLSLVAIAGCSSAAPTNTVPSQTASTPASTESPAPTEEDAPTTAKVIVIDVRSQEEWDSGHVEQAIHIPHTEIAERISEVTDNKDAEIVVYCAVGGRAGKAKTTLETLGFTNVENAGGYDDVKDRFKD
jgi:phage shock protein E